jgi:succinyl-diaminopimelate desuccinylase
MSLKDYGDLISRVDSYREFVVKFLEEIVAIPTVSPWGDNYGDFARVAKELLESVGVSVDIHRVPQDYVDPRVPPEGRGKARYIVFARVGSRDNVVIHFNGHYDVVPGGPGWMVTEPFKPRIVDNRLFGRGSTDMKGGIAAIAGALASLSSYADRLGIGVEAAFVPDEEIGGGTGTGYLVENSLVRGRYVVIAEPSSLSQIYIGHKGAVWGEVVVKGKTGHGSTPWLGINAFEKAVAIAKEMFEKLVPSIEAKRSRYTYDLEEGNRGTIMIGGYLRGGEKINQIPGEVVFSFDRRLTVEERVEEAWKEIKEFVENTAKRVGADVEVRPAHTMEPVIVDPEARIFKAIEEASKIVIGSMPRKIVCIGGLDMRYYVAKGIETATYGPGVLGMAHAPNEYVETDDVIRAAKIYTILPTILHGKT